MIRGLFSRKQPPAAGRQAENFAARFLKKQGLKVVSTNYRCRVGEIDIIARHLDSTVFVEVRLRNHPSFASGAESVDYFKQKKIIASANHYLQQQFGNHPPPCRFDVVSLAEKPTKPAEFEVEWIQDAFRPEF